MANVDYILPIGAEVSAKYRGAFCEAHVDKVARRATCSVVFNDLPGKKMYELNSESDIRGTIRLGETVEARHGDSQWLPAVIKKIVDHSMYTVVFNDGDVRQLRRSHLCRKGDRHFSGDESLDNAPLTNPDHFGTPVGKKRSRLVIPLERTPAHSHANTPSSSPSKQRAAAASSPTYEGRLAEWLGKVVCVSVERGAASANNSLNESISRTPQGGSSGSGNQATTSSSGTFQTPSSTSEDAASKPKSAAARKEAAKKRRLATVSNEEQCESEEGSSVKSTQSASTRASAKNQPNSPAAKVSSATRQPVGNNSPKQAQGAPPNWYPALVCLPNAALIDADLSRFQKGYLLVRSFKDNRFACVAHKNVTEFSSELALKHADRDRSLRAAVEKALTYLDTRELPPSWNRTELLGSASDDEAEASDEETGERSDDESVDDRAREASDRFVAQLYTFMDDRGTPINKAPAIANRDLDLFRLHRIVREMGGFNRVSTQLRWRVVYSRMQLPHCPSASSLLKTAYRKYILPFDEFQRKLGFAGSLEHAFATDTSLRRTTLNSSLGSHSSSAAAASPPHSSSAQASTTTTAPAVGPSQVASTAEQSNTSEVVPDSTPSTYASPAKSVSASSSPHPSASGTPGSASSSTNVTAIGRVTRHAPTGRRLFTPRGAKGKRGATAGPSQKDGDGNQANLTLSTVKESDSEKDADSAAPNSETTSPEKKAVDTTRRSVSANSPENSSKPAEPAVSAPQPIVVVATPTPESEEKPLAIGTRIRVRYVDSRTYEAKVIDIELDAAKNTTESSGTANVESYNLDLVRYKIHYAGWNNRHDEWIRRDRIVRILDENAPVSASAMKKRSDILANNRPGRKRGGANRARVITSKRSRDGNPSDSDCEKQSDTDRRQDDDADSTSTPADSELQTSGRSRSNEEVSKLKTKDEVSATKVKVEGPDESAASVTEERATARSDAQRDERASLGEPEEDSTKQKSAAGSSKRTLRKRKPSSAVAESGQSEGETAPPKVADDPSQSATVAKRERLADEKEEVTPQVETAAAPVEAVVSETDRRTDSPNSAQQRDQKTASKRSAGGSARKKSEPARATPNRNSAQPAAAANDTASSQPVAAQSSASSSSVDSSKPPITSTSTTSTVATNSAPPPTITVTQPQDQSALTLQVGNPSTSVAQAQRSPASSRSPTKAVAPSSLASPNRAPKYNFLIADLDRFDRDRRIELLTEKITELRKVYSEIRSEMLDIDRKRKRLKQREKEERDTKEKEATTNTAPGAASCVPGSLIAAASGSCTSISTLTSTTLSDST